MYLSSSQVFTDVSFTFRVHHSAIIIIHIFISYSCFHVWNIYVENRFHFQGAPHCWMSFSAPVLLRVWLLQDNGWSILNLNFDHLGLTLVGLSPAGQFVGWCCYPGQVDWEEGYIRDCNGKSNGGTIDRGIDAQENVAGVCSFCVTHGTF